METEPTNYLVNLPATLETIKAGVYANPPFEGGVEARNVLETSLAQKANADAAAVNEAVAAGSSRADAVAPYLADDQFQGLALPISTASFPMPLHDAGVSGHRLTERTSEAHLRHESHRTT